MGFLHKFEHILTRLPEVQRPRYALSFKERIKWTGFILLAYFFLKETALYGMDPQAVDIFENMRAIIAGGFGSVISLGIGPIVTASIILQILVGGKMIDIDLANPQDRKIYQGTQKLLAIGFTLFEAAVMVLMGALPALNGDPGLQLLIIAQLTLGGIIIIYMDEVVSKWGFGSGIGLFIVAGVCSEIAVGAFNPLPAVAGEAVPAGSIPAFIYFILGNQTRFDLLIPLIATLIIFAAVVYVESVRVEIPISYGKFRGTKGRYPIKFIYASVIPIIFASILMANVQLWASMLVKAGYPLLGEFAGNRPINGVAYYMQRPNPIYSPDFNPVVAFVYVIVLITLAILFSKFWVETASMDSKTVAKQLQKGGMKIPGFRGDIRIIEKVLDRYIPAVTVLGGATVGLLAAFGDLTGALGGGTGVLLCVGIVYKMYEEMAKEQLFEVNPMLRKIMGDLGI
ncbi:preprotein translocase subunit SecY [archaeon]|nr:preprotein translocase subunit SecY [archaeon]